ncbi:MAG: hypothetical protein M1814_002547 [Vezdaea aestivalis]|nr:MAG: hypothetical protein M1814_002547 [Vezdaea aestivalis]
MATKGAYHGPQHGSQYAPPAMAPSTAYNNGYQNVPMGQPQPQAHNNGYDGVPVSEYSDEQFDQLKKQDVKLKRQIRLLKFVSRFATMALSMAIMIILAITLHKFYSTQDVVRGGRNPWFKAGTKLWPTTMLLAVAAVGFFINLCMMLLYLKNVKWANYAATTSTVFSVSTFLAQIILWAVVAGLYRYGRDTNGISDDIWGWTCSSGAAKIQDQFNDVVHFNQLCGIQTSSWHLSVATAVVEVLAAVVWIFIIRRMMHKKKVQRETTAFPMK